MRKKDHGFTLLELLVVIAIIGLLAALVLPLFSRSRRCAIQTSCAKNLSSIGKAMMMYSDVPANASFPAKDMTKGKESLALLVPLYMPDARVFKCPSDSTILKEEVLRMNSDPAYAKCSYLYDPKLASLVTSLELEDPKKNASAVSAIILGDKDGRQGTSKTNGHGTGAGQNVLYASGSVEWNLDAKNPIPNSEGKIDSDIYAVTPGANPDSNLIP